MVTPTPATDVTSPPLRSPRPRVGVVVLNWNSGWFTRRCLRSLADQDYPAERLRTVLVDNGSIDGSLEELTAWLAQPGAPVVEVLANGANLGFAEGCNRAMRLLMEPGDDRVEHVALLNNDAWAEPSWVSEMVAVMAAEPRCAAVSSRLLLEPGFAAIDIDAGDSPVTLGSVLLEGAHGVRLDVAGRVRTEGFSDEGALEWPARRVWRLGSGQRGRLWVPAAHGERSVRLELIDASGGTSTVERRLPASRTTLLNGLGTGINPSGEGFDIGYGEPDPGGRDAHTGNVSEVVAGFCGGAALLRAEVLEHIGLFDPAFFAYYEDTDLSWRMRNAGWEVRTSPGAIVHHAFGASGGGGSRWHLFLDRRNWLVTNLRNGDRSDLRRVAGWWRRGTWRLFRANLFGRVRRGRPMQVEPLWTWKLAALAAVIRSGRARRESRPGWRATDRVRGPFQPSGSPRAPEPWPGGPVVTYLDVGETIKAGYRAGIQRVVCALVAEMPAAHPDIELVPIRWCERNRRFRRVTAEEHASLLRAGGVPEAPEESATVSGAKAAVRATLGRLGVLSAVRVRREQFFGARRRALEDELVIERLAPGAVLLEADAVWNDLDIDRAELLADVSASGAHVVSFVHDLLPIDHPDWFAPRLRRIFVPAALAQLRHSELLLCASRATGTQIAEVCVAEGIAVPDIGVVALGSGTVDTWPGADVVTPAQLPAALEGGRYLLVVGTLEPRKNQGLALDVFDRLAGDFPDLHLVFAGRTGWGVDELAARIDAHPLHGCRLHWLQDIHDEQLEWLYSHAFLALVPSLSEGFGLPLVEALGRGVPAVASGGGALAETGGDAALYCDPDDVDGWTGLVRSQLADDDAHAAAVSRATGFPRTAWSVTARRMAEALVAAFG